MGKELKKNVTIEVVKYLASAVAVMIIGAAIILAQGNDPVKAFVAIIQGALGDLDCIAQTIRWCTPAMLAGMAAVIAFKSGVMNLGIEGQIYIGAFASAVVGYAVALPLGVHIVVALAAGGLAALLFAAIPAVLKLYFGINEMIVTLMLNYIAILLTEYLTIQVMGGNANIDVNTISTPDVLETARLTFLFPPNQATTGIFIALGVVILVHLVYKYTVKGYELKQVGDNIKFAKFGGVHVQRTFISIFLLSGFIAGLCGAVEILGPNGRFRSSFSSNFGWDGIMIALIAKNNPFAVVVVSIIWSILKCGSLAMERVTDTSRLVVTLIQALFVLFVSIDYGAMWDKWCQYRINCAKRKQEGA